MNPQASSGFLNIFGASLDFTQIKYQQLLTTIMESDYSPVTVRDYFEKTPKRCIIIRHDVDLSANHALKIAKVESDMDIKSTYYFRMKSRVFVPEIITQIAALGHEIGYHYEVLDKAKGDYDIAINIFEQELSEFRKIADVKTICMHGNPFTSHLNRDLWNEYDYRDFGIIGEPYISIDYNKVLYLTDTSRTWMGKGVAIKDTVESDRMHNVKCTNDLIRLILQGDEEQICIVLHPVRWSVSLGAWVYRSILENVKKVGKAGIIFLRK